VAGISKRLCGSKVFSAGFGYQRSTANGDDVLISAAKRYRVDAEKLQKAVALEFAAKLAKTGKSKQISGKE
jgi:hypothetical protein